MYPKNCYFRPIYAPCKYNVLNKNSIIIFGAPNEMKRLDGEGVSASVPNK